ncbi:hypothetical protein GX51_04403 [Blastomyces parvus]|uniref:Uncharacterized protein n=1 Tax=Blastomyces parvus TaxID=2060905 RepID=A0A2B7X220_9EURO|nr:hypothetical protein GX51_04403 [Blastomyces parvus]
MEQKVFETFPGDQVTDAMLGEAAKLFNENYGVWGKQSHYVLFLLSHTLSGNPVKTKRSPSVGAMLAQLYCYKLCEGDCGWESCWKCFCVSLETPRKKHLLSHPADCSPVDTHDMYGIMSSHPVAGMAAASSYGSKHSLLHDNKQYMVLSITGGIEKVSLDLIKENAKAVMEASPISYIKNAKLCGALFNPEDSTGLICGVDTGFYVDHEEPLDVLERVRQDFRWPLGDLLDGHEYLLILPGKKRLSKWPSPSKSKKDISSC